MAADRADNPSPDQDAESDEGREKSPRALLEEAVNAVPRAKSEWEKRVILAWFSRMDAHPLVLNRSDDTHTTWCSDCSSGIDPTEADFHWNGWGSLCAPCSLHRLAKGGHNPRIDERDEKLMRSKFGDDEGNT